MKAVILAGGYGSRLSEETTIRPKPMVEIGGRPMLWHIMKIYSHYGINDFIICCGYKGHMIKEYFTNYFLFGGDVRVDLQQNKLEVLKNRTEPWTVTCVETGLETATGGRLRRIREYLDDEPFCFTYGDGVCDVDIGSVVEFHQQEGTLATLTAVQPPARYGAFDLNDADHRVHFFKEKVKGDGTWINGGFFVIEPSAIDYIEDDMMMWEFDPLERLAREGQLSAFRHGGFWRCMDHLSDKMHLEDAWASGAPPWKVWA